MPTLRCVAFWLTGLALGATSPAARADEFHKHVVVSVEANASDVGRDILRQGGNAIDAAVATAFALAVTHPAAGNLGGGGFLVAFRAETREVVTIDFREAAPAAAAERMYLGPDGKLLPHHRAGARAAAVPGTVRGLGLASRLYGKRPWAELVRPAARLAREGFPVTETLARSLNAQLFPDLKHAEDVVDHGTEPDSLAKFASSIAAFRKSDSTTWKTGDRLVQPDLAATLDRIAEQGADEIYTGQTARLIASYMAHENGLITLEDLAGYRARDRLPLHSTFRGFDVYGVGPPSSGGIVLAQMLNILERFELKADGPRSPRTLHRVTEAMRRGFYTRATAIADPDFVSVPTVRLISKEYAGELARSITDRATPSAQLADFPVLPAEGEHTTHLSTIDSEGNAVALTYTLEESFGSKAVVAGAGFLLNNEMGDFNLIPGRTDTAGQIGTSANRIAPGKRMLSSQTPTIVVKDGQVLLVTGSPGGRTIPNTVLWVVLNVLEFDLEPKEAVKAPRTHHAWFPDQLRLEGSGWEAATIEALSQMGHKVELGRTQGDAHTIVVDRAQRTIYGVPDPRRKTSKASGD
ncbi:MAG TPA: gamma-glutamyltransferase [Isosphaeraceae bacterium]|jgi:gamma-glutamyltranspeptidase/glutathione hydrolase|nr:gamma-glutamyltransferase [Isosphaeraceae bacterium]